LYQEKSHMRSALIAWLLVLSVFKNNCDIWAQAPAPEVRINLLTLPSSRQAIQKLPVPASVACENVGLREVLPQLAERFDFTYWIDRRVDADAPLKLLLPQATLEECLQRLAQLSDAEAGLVENVVVIAPRGRLATLQYCAVRFHDQLSRAAAGAGREIPPARLQPVEWPLLTTPSQLAQRLGNTWNLAPVAELPHDLMNAGRLRACTAATQLTLLYGGFDRVVSLDAQGRLAYSNPPQATQWRATYPESAIMPEAVAATRQAFPAATIESHGRTVQVAGTTAAHLSLLGAAGASRRPGSARSENVAGPPSRPPRPGGESRSGGASRGSDLSDAATRALDAQRLTFELKNQTLSAALEYLSQNLSFELRWDASLQPADREKRVSLSAREQPLNTVLEGLADASGLKIRRSGTVVEVSR
jgi:hypothetical protein